MDATAGLSRRERQIVHALYRRGQATVAEVIEELADPPSYSAVRATLRILEEKGHVVHEEDGPRYVYSPVVEPEEAQEAALEHVVRTFFQGSTEEAAVTLLRMSDTEIEESDYDRLARKIRDAAREGR